MTSSDVDTWSEDDLIEYFDNNQISDTDVQSVNELRLLVKGHKERNEQASQAECMTREDIVVQDPIKQLELIVDKDQAKRQDLIQLYKKIQHFDETFAENINLQKQYPDRIMKLNGYISDLKKQTCPIVVAGEVGSGKSSFINLLIGQKIFPSSHLPCTSVICQLQNSERRAMTVTFDDRQTDSHNLPDLKTLQDLMRQFVGYNRTSRQRKCKQINIFWPIPLLPENVALVDVPGIGECCDMDREVLKYISKALVCIYVVFSSNAGGVQKDKLKLILDHRIQSFIEDRVNSLFEHTLFLCNHWDEVRVSGEENTVWNDTLSQLKSSIGDLNEDNVMKLSVKEAARNLKMGFVCSQYVKDWEKIRQRFNSLLLDSLTAKTSHHYSMMETTLHETEKYLAYRRRLAAFQGNDKTQLLTKIKSELEVIDKEAEKSKQKILRSIEQDFKDIATRLHAFIHSEETTNRLLNSKQEQPENDESQLHLEAIEKVQCAIQEWEDKEQRIAGVKKKVEENVKESIGKILLMIEDIDLALENSYQDARHEQGCRRQETSTMIHTTFSIVSGLGTSLLSRLVVRVNPFVGLAVGLVIGIPFLLYLQRKNIARSIACFFQPKLRYYIKHILNKSLTAEKLSDDIMLTCCKPLQQSVEKSFDDHVKTTTEANKRQLEIIKKDKRLSEEIIVAIREATDSFSQIIGQFNIFQLVHLSEDYISDENMKTESYIGGGQFSNVYKATMKFSDRSSEVALKVFKRQIQPETVNKQMSELEKFRKLRHDNIVEYFGVHVYPNGVEGANIMVDGREGGRRDHSTDDQPCWMKVFGKTLAICLELCDESLEENAFRTFRIQERLTIHEEGSVSTGDRSAALAHYQKIIQGVSSGLAYIHDRGYMHGDLKLSNVFIRDGVAKITDFGLSRACDLSHNTMAGTLTHMSPEMLEQKECSKPTDVYSMAILMWEFWYGQLSFTEESLRMNFIEFTKAIVKGLRPKMSADVQMPSQLHELVVACWQVDPNKRPTASEIRERFKDLYH